MIRSDTALESIWLHRFEFSTTKSQWHYLVVRTCEIHSLRKTKETKTSKQHREENNNLTTMSGSHEAIFSNQYAIARRTVMDIISIRMVTRNGATKQGSKMCELYVQRHKV